MFITLVAAACGSAVGLSWHHHKSSQPTIGAKDSTLPAAPLVPLRQEIASNAGGWSLHNQGVVQTGNSLFPTNPKQEATAGSPLFPNLPQDNVTPPAQAFREPPGNRLSSTNSSRIQSGETLPASLNPNIPTDSATLPGQALQQPPVDGGSLESPSEQQPATTFWVPPEFQAKIVKKITPVEQEKVIALTFDDGPWPHNTLKVLDILKKNKIKATFFWVGQALKDNPQIAQQVVAEGHAIGNHTWHHWYKKLDPSTAAHEIEDTAELIYKTTGVRTSLFRPPGGVMNNGVADYAKQKKNVIVMWSNDPMDYRPHAANQLSNYVIRKAQPGGIVLMHDGGGNHSATVQALPEIIAKLREQGYRFVTIPELLEMRDPKASEVIAKKDSPSLLHTKP
jgi:peptidoglycan/xylan/chitin deacetylase (PgdA/CDA1 family)